MPRLSEIKEAREALNDLLVQHDLAVKEDDNIDIAYVHARPLIDLLLRVNGYDSNKHPIMEISFQGHDVGRMWKNLIWR